MCYNLVSATKKKLDYAIASGADPDVIAKLLKKLEELLEKKIKSHYFVTGFDHPELITVSGADASEATASRWGLIPSWIKDKAAANEIQNQTLNARGETIFEKPAFRNAAETKRCIVLIDAFYEYHHLRGKTFPYHISLRSGEVMPLAGLYDDWVNTETGEIIRSVSIVTTEGNELMKGIHNNPKADGPRMPVILPAENKKVWLNPDADQKTLEEILIPFDENLMQAHTVKRQRGKEGIGDVPEAEKEFLYSELNDLFSGF